MTAENFWERLDTIIESYLTMSQHELWERWQSWSLDLSAREMYEVVGALLARQVTLASQLGASPGIWNSHIAPLILRSMADNYITLAWILNDPIDRSRKFFLYGLGQEKLQMEHLKARLEADSENAEDHPDLKRRQKWLDAQRYSFMTEVNIGSWAGIDTRTMAEEADCLDFYNYSFQPFTSATHNMWNHVGKWNLLVCPNPLHRYHRMPAVRSLPPNPYFVLEAASYLEKAFSLFDEKTSNTAKPPSANEQLIKALDNLGNSLATSSDSDDD